MVPNDRVQIPGQPYTQVAPPNGPPTAATSRPSTQTVVKPKKHETPAVKDAFREVVETVVFVIVLVLLLKTFVAEAFVIPTGSMAETLLGHHIEGNCPKCGHHFTVNASSEMDDPDSEKQRVTGCKCPNCGFHIKGQE